jgi:hypothetical protein
MIMALDHALVEIAAFDVAEFDGYGICDKRVGESGWRISCRCRVRQCTIEKGTAPVFEAVPCPLRT